MEEAKRKEEISKSYLNAICAIKGIDMEEVKHDGDSIDAILKKTIHRKDNIKYNASISVQLKSTSSDYTEFKKTYSYPLKKKNYDDLFDFIYVHPVGMQRYVQQCKRICPRRRYLQSGCCGNRGERLYFVFMGDVSVFARRTSGNKTMGI